MLLGKRIYAMAYILATTNLHCFDAIEPITTIAVTAGAVTAGASLAATSVQSLSQGSGIRNVVFEISNYLDVPMYGGSYYLYRGFNAVSTPSFIQSHTKEATQFSHTFHTAKGTQGVIEYTIGDDNLEPRFAVIFCVGFSGDNWFGLRWIEERTAIDLSLYNSMHDDPGWNSANTNTNNVYTYATSGKPLAIYSGDYIIAATMSNASRAVLKLSIFKKAGGYTKNRKYYKRSALETTIEENL